MRENFKEIKKMCVRGGNRSGCKSFAIGIPKHMVEKNKDVFYRIRPITNKEEIIQEREMLNEGDIILKSGCAPDFSS